MMPSFGKARSVALTGVTGALVTAEAQVSDGLPQFAIVGLPDASIRESRERIRSACLSSGVGIAADHLTINLSPGWIPKTGTSFDLATAMAILAAKNMVEARVSDIVFLAELGLDGQVRPVRGILPAVAHAAAAGVRRIVVAQENQREAELVAGPDIIAVQHLLQCATRFAAPDTNFAPYIEKPVSRVAEKPQPAATEAVDMAEVKGQPQARFGVEVAAAGGHHMLLIGAPGAGKTMLARRFPGLLPQLSDRAAQEVTSVHSLAMPSGLVEQLIRTPPFEDPHHSATATAIIGGGSKVLQPGAASRAHHGVLFLDEAPEFSNRVLQALRQPLESGEIVVARAAAQARFPASFQLILAANPCPCGYAMDPAVGCECPALAKRRYLNKISAPLLDRVDVQVAVAKVTRAHMTSTEVAENTAAIAARVRQARDIQHERWRQYPWQLNAHVPGSVLRGPLQLPAADRRCIDIAMDRGSLTARGYDRTLRLAWTIADVAGNDRPTADHVGQALSLRSLAGAL